MPVLVLGLMFRKMVDLEEVTWKDKKIPLTEEGKLSSTDSKQTTLSDF
jgi:hypothetical protein